MKIALAAARFINGDTAFNLAQIERFTREAAAGGADLACFGEAFLQGFDGLAWNYETDQHIAITLASPEMTRLKALTTDLAIDLAFGFIERAGETLYSSWALLSGGEIIRLYRRISVGWKEVSLVDGHYQEGDAVEPFVYRGMRCLIALCGDLWVYPERYRQEADLLFWPVYVDFTPEQWANGEQAAYAAHAGTVCSTTLLINSHCDGEDRAKGGCCLFSQGQVIDALPMEQEGLLFITL